MVPGVGRTGRDMPKTFRIVNNKIKPEAASWAPPSLNVQSPEPNSAGAACCFNPGAK